MMGLLVFCFFNFLQAKNSHYLKGEREAVLQSGILGQQSNLLLISPLFTHKFVVLGPAPFIVMYIRNFIWLSKILNPKH